MLPSLALGLIPGYLLLSLFLTVYGGLSGDEPIFFSFAPIFDLMLSLPLMWSFAYLPRFLLRPVIVLLGCYSLLLVFAAVLWLCDPALAQVPFQETSLWELRQAQLSLLLLIALQVLKGGYMWSRWRRT